MTATNKKLIEVALPLEAINIASAREKSIRHGHPSTLHLWWARRPLAAARAVIFSQMVDDPSSYLDELRGDARLLRKAQGLLEKRTPVWEKVRTEHERATAAGMNAPTPGPEPTLDDILAEIERDRLFKIIEDLVLWENTTNEKVLDKARAEIWQSWRRTCARNADHPRAAELFDRNKLPAFHDPFAGGGALPLEAQRLGLESYASDLNPVAVLINKAMIEIPPKFAGRPPVHPPEEGQAEMPREWKGAQGLAEDVRYYGQWMRDEAEKRIGHLYPKIEITAEMVNERPDLKEYLGQKLTVIAWIWARTVKSPNPAFAHVDVPLASTFILSTKAGKAAYVLPVVEGDSYRFTVKVGKPKTAEVANKGTKFSRGSFRCLLSDTPIPYSYIDDEANAGRMSARMMAIVAESKYGRLYLDSTGDMERIAQTIEPSWKSDVPSRGTWGSNAQGRRYGFYTFGDYFTRRQLVALTTFSDLVGEARARVVRDSIAAGLKDDKLGLEAGGVGVEAYADAISVYLAFAQSKACNRNSSLCLWEQRMDRLVATFGRQALSMAWDYAETNPLAGAGGDIRGAIESVAEVLDKQFLFAAHCVGKAAQADAISQVWSQDKVVSTDPPYYDNIGYADLSDFFYVWLRRSLQTIFPDLFATISVPKSEELIASQYRHGGKEKADEFFLSGMSRALTSLATQCLSGYPLTIYYAFKQSESEGSTGVASTGWETFLAALVQAGYWLLGTWPVRTEQPKGLRVFEQNALASSVVLVCRPRVLDAGTISRRDFINLLKRELPGSLRLLQNGNIAPVDLAQAAIGPGMAIFSGYSRVLDSDGQPLTIREALVLINQTLDEVLAEQEGDFDADTRWALAWFEQYGFDEGEYGVAETLSKAKNTSVTGMVEAGILTSSRGKVRLLKPDELPESWDPSDDDRLTTWEAVHHLVRILEAGGESAAAALVGTLGGRAEIARELCYRLYTVCERKKRAAEALSYNGLVQSWPEIIRLAQEGVEGSGHAQMALPGANEAQ